MKRKVFQLRRMSGFEPVFFVKPVSDRIVVATSAGQLFAVNSSTGQLAWHTRLSQSGPIDRLLAEGDENMFRLRFQMSMGQMEGIKKLRELKKDRARILTVIRQTELAAQKEGK